MRKLMTAVLLLAVCGAGTAFLTGESDAAKSPRKQKFVFNGKTYASKRAFVESGDRCGTPTPTAKEMAEVAAAVKAVPAANTQITVPIQYHHITWNGQGNITEQQRQEQTQILNDAFAPYNVTFVYDPQTHPPTFTNNQAWYNMQPGSAAEQACKQALNVDPQSTLNFYTSDGGGLLGWATFPWSLAGNPAMDGVVCLDQSLPGGTASPYNLGDTGTHEVGHWLGLYHTFQGGCVGNGDEVADTVAHASPNYGCPNPNLNNGACDPQQRAPVQNFMNYTDDACMDRFTVGQGDRVASMVSQYRPALVGGSPPPPCECPLDCIQQSVDLPIKLTDSTLDRLRLFRDAVLAQTDDGRELTKAYYDHSGEVYRLMIMNPGLGAETMRFLMTVLPALEASTVNDAIVEMPTEQFEQGLILIEKFRARGSDDFGQTLDKIEQILGQRAEVDTATTRVDFAPSAVAVAP